jgi:basic amino acid/polyamine antiporter, APA family
MTAELRQPGLVRAVSRWQLVGMAINDVVGSGVYLLPATAAAMLGSASVWAVIVAGFAVSLLVLCFAEASSHFDQPGGAYLYTREAFGRFVGFEVGWMTWLARVATLASLANGLVQAAAYFSPRVAHGWRRATIICVVIVVLARINTRGVKAGARTSVALVIAKMVPLIFFIVVGLWFVDGARLVVHEAPRSSALAQAALLLIFAYGGFENTPAAAGEYRNPRRDVPFALLVTIGCVTLLYSSVQAVALGTLPELATSSSPLAAAAARFSGHWGAALVSVGAVLSIVGLASNVTLSGPRYLLALSSDGYGPRWLARLHPVYHTPANAIFLQTAVVLALALSGSFVLLAMLSVIARIATYIGTAAAVPILRRRMGLRPDAVRLPLGATIPIAALALSITLLASATRTELLLAAAALTAGSVVFALRRPVDGAVPL